MPPGVRMMRVPCPRTPCPAHPRAPCLQGLVYSPGKSWVAGIALLVVGVGIFVITALTAAIE